MKLTETQKQALEQIKADATKEGSVEYCFGEVFNEVSRKSFSKATLQALVKAGYITVKHSFTRHKRYAGSSISLELRGKRTSGFNRRILSSLRHDAVLQYIS